MISDLVEDDPVEHFKILLGSQGPPFPLRLGEGPDTMVGCPLLQAGVRTRTRILGWNWIFHLVALVSWDYHVSGVPQARPRMRGLLQGDFYWWTRSSEPCGDHSAFRGSSLCSEARVEIDPGIRVAVPQSKPL